MRRLLLAFIFSICVIPVVAQTASELAKSYGKPTLAYSVTEHVWMTPDFAADGQVCRMRFYPKRADRETSYLGGHVDIGELQGFLNRLVPPASRGKKKPGFGMANLGGGVGQTEYGYENISLLFQFSLKIDPDVKKNSGERVLLDLPGDPLVLPQELLPSTDDDFQGNAFTEIVSLRWNDRTCAEDSKGRSKKNQTVAELEQQFGEPQKIYSVSSNISMMADFTVDGNVCRMRLFPKRVSPTTNYLFR